MEEIGSNGEMEIEFKKIELKFSTKKHVQNILGIV